MQSLTLGAGTPLNFETVTITAGVQDVTTNDTTAGVERSPAGESFSNFS